MILLLAGIHLLNWVLKYRLLIFGIYPRRLRGLPGIMFAPFLHADFNHFFFNAIPLFVLADFMLLYGFNFFIKASLAIILLSGSLLWLFGRNAIHIGASALITGYWAYLVINTYHQGGLLAITLGIVCVYYFSGIFFGIFPMRRGVSWEGHLFGLIAGILTNYGFFLV